MATQSNNKVIKAGAGYVIGNYLIKGITFLSAPIFTRLFTTEEFGEINTFFSYESILYIIIGLALHSSLNKAYFKYKEKFNEYTSSLVLMLLVSTAIWFALANIFYDLYKDVFGYSQFLANMLIVNCLANSLLQFYCNYIGISYEFKRFVVISSINAISSMVVSIVLVLTIFKDAHCEGRIIGYTIPFISIGIYIMAVFFRKARPIVKKDYWVFGLTYSLPLIPHGISQVVLGAFDKIMIRDMVGSSEAGIYSFASTVLLIFRVAANSLENVWKPWVFEKLDAKDYDAIKKQGARFAFGMAIFLCLLIMVSPELIMILGDREYWGSTDCVIPVLVGGYFAFIYVLPAMVEYYYEKTKHIAIGTVSAAVINLALNYVCIRQWGYIAAAYTTVATYLLYFVFHYVSAKRIQGYSLFNTKQLLLTFLCIFLIGAAGIFLAPFWYFRWPIALGIGLCGLIWAEKNFKIIEVAKNKFGRR